MILTTQAGAILDEVPMSSGGKIQYLTLAPQIAGRDRGENRMSLAMGTTFAPRDPRWGTPTDVRLKADLLFLRYFFDRRSWTRCLEPVAICSRTGYRRRIGFSGR